jgi:fructose transport system ATP-binding protein
MKMILKAERLKKNFGSVVAMDGADFDLKEGEILSVIGDNGAGKSTMIKALCGAITPDSGKIFYQNKEVQFTSPLESHEAGIETVYQTLALCPALSIVDNMFLGRELYKGGKIGSFFKILDSKKMRKIATQKFKELGLLTIQNINQAVETLSGGQRQAIAISRAVTFNAKVVIMDEPTAALGVKESRKVLDLILDVRERGISIILISHNMPHVFELSDRIHIHRHGKRCAVVSPKECSMSDAVSIMTGAKT